MTAAVMSLDGKLFLCPKRRPLFVFGRSRKSEKNCRNEEMPTCKVSVTSVAISIYHRATFDKESAPGFNDAPFLPPSVGEQ